MENGHTAILSGLLAVESARRYPGLESDQSLRRFLRSKVALPVSSVRVDSGFGAVDFSPDGNRAVASRGDEIIVWDIETGKEIVRLKSILIPWLSDIQFSQNGKWLLATDCDESEGTVLNVPHCANTVARIFDTTKWEEVSRITQNYGGGIIPGSVAFSPNSKWIASGGNDGTIIVWDIATGKEISHIANGYCCVSPVVFNPDGKWIGAGSPNNNTASIWDAASGREVAQMTHEAYIKSVAFSPNGDLVASASDDGIIKIWQVNTGNEVTRMTLSNKISTYTIRFSSDGKWLISKDNDNAVRVWNVSTGQEISKMADNGGSDSFAVSPDGKWIVSTIVNMAQVWEAATGREIARMFHDDSINSLAFSSDGKKIISGSSDGTAQVWEINTYQDISYTEHSQEVSSVAFSPNGKWVASGSWDGTTRIWHAKTGQELSRMTVDGLVTAIEFSSDNNWVAQAACEGVSRGVVACGEPIIRIWEASTGKELFRLKPEYGVETVKFMPDNKRIIIADTHARIQMLELENETVLATFSPDLTGFQPAGMSGALNSFSVPIDVDPSGQRVVAGSLNSVQVWDLNSAQEVYRTPHDGFSSVAFSWDGNWIVSARNDIRILDAESGEEVKQIPIDLASGGVGSIVFSPDGKWLAGTSGTLIRVWELSTGREYSRMIFAQPISSLNFSQDGKWIVSGGNDNIGRVSLWQSEDLVTQVCKRLTRNFTQEEWKQYFGDEPYRATCPNLPIEPEVTMTPTP